LSLSIRPTHPTTLSLSQSGGGVTGEAVEEGGGGRGRRDQSVVYGRLDYTQREVLRVTMRE